MTNINYFPTEFNWVQRVSVLESGCLAQWVPTPAHVAERVAWPYAGEVERATEKAVLLASVPSAWPGVSYFNSAASQKEP